MFWVQPQQDDDARSVTLQLGNLPHAHAALSGDNPRFMKRLIAAYAAAVLVSGGLGLGLAAGAARAGTGVPHHWCPGDHDSTAPTTVYDWDWNICHTYYWVKSNQGNVPFEGHLPSSLWDGDNPPADSTPPCGTDMFTGRPGAC